MFNIKNILRQALLALALCGASVAAHADVLPATFRVTLNTAGLPGGYLDVAFNVYNIFDEPALSTATITNLQGAFGAFQPLFGDVHNPSPGVFTISNDTTEMNYMSFAFGAGEWLSFDVSFSGDFLTLAGNQTSEFSVALLDTAFKPIGDAMGDAVFNITQISDAGPAAIGYVPSEEGLARVTAVPEPSELLLVLTGLAMMGFLLRRRA